MNENEALYKSQGRGLANPDTLPRVKLVIRKIKELTGTSKVHTSSITFTDSKNVEVKTKSGEAGLAKLMIYTKKAICESQK